MNKKRVLSIAVSTVVAANMAFGMGQGGKSLNAYADTAKKKTTISQKHKEKTAANDSFSLDKTTYKAELPKVYTLSQSNKDEVKFIKNSKKAVGGISLIGCEDDRLEAVLPNHSELLKAEDISSKIGKGKLFLLNMSSPAAAKKHKSWNEIHVVIPSDQKNIAYDIWLETNGKNDNNEIKTVKKILNSIEKI